MVFDFTRFLRSYAGVKYIDQEETQCACLDCFETLFSLICLVKYVDDNRRITESRLRGSLGLGYHWTTKGEKEASHAGKFIRNEKLNFNTHVGSRSLTSVEVIVEVTFLDLFTVSIQLLMFSFTVV